MKAVVMKPNGDFDVWGNVLALQASDETGFLTVSHGDSRGVVHVHCYLNGDWTSVSIDVRTPADYDLFPQGCK